MAFNFNGKKYKNASSHQKEWGNKLITELNLIGNESILDLGCGDGVLTEQLAYLVPNGNVVGIDASIGMIKEAQKRSGDNLSFMKMDINELNFIEKFDVIYSNAALHWIKNHKKLLENSKKALKKNGFIYWNFAGYGNCLNIHETFIELINDVQFRLLFRDFNWPWYMPLIQEYEELVVQFDFSKYKISLENADRFFDSKFQMIQWIDQPSIVPFLEHLVDNKVKVAFRNSVIKKMIQKCQQEDGRCFETFRRLLFFAQK